MYILPQGKKTQTAHSNYKEIKLEINKNALNNKHIATETAIIYRESDLPRYFSIQRPDTYPIPMEIAIKITYLGSPHA